MRILYVFVETQQTGQVRTELDGGIVIYLHEYSAALVIKLYEQSAHSRLFELFFVQGVDERLYPLVITRWKHYFCLLYTSDAADE